MSANLGPVFLMPRKAMRSSNASRTTCCSRSKSTLKKTEGFVTRWRGETSWQNQEPPGGIVQVVRCFINSAFSQATQRTQRFIRRVRSDSIKRFSGANPGPPGVNLDPASVKDFHTTPIEASIHDPLPFLLVRTK